MQPTELFTRRVGNYVRFRPDYPAEVIALLESRCGLGAGRTVADIGSGTGIFTAQLLATGAEVYGVEPNPAMRSAADAALHDQPLFHSVPTRAEATQLPDASIDLYVAAQAFHWFDVDAARTEALRIVRPGAWAALVWNEHPSQSTGFMADYDALLHEFAPEFGRVAAQRTDESRMRRFLGERMICARFAHAQHFDFEGLRGRLLSSSYAPEAGHPDHDPMLVALQTLFDRHQREGQVEFRYETRVYHAQLRAG